LGLDTRVFLASAELAAVCALLGRIPTLAEYAERVRAVEAGATEVYRYMNFDRIEAFRDAAAGLARQNAR
ncbi:MAG: hypothetical protein LBI59_05455, partial [Candidatus Accumulibacter sp.]|nr:hypothetical protein [Accumulibacter sp.]